MTWTSVRPTTSGWWFYFDGQKVWRYSLVWTDPGPGIRGRSILVSIDRTEASDKGARPRYTPPKDMMDLCKPLLESMGRGFVRVSDLTGLWCRVPTPKPPKGKP